MAENSQSPLQNAEMLARFFSAALSGLEAFPVELEVDSGNGDGVIVIVGLPDAARQRIARPGITVQASTPKQDAQLPRLEPP